MRWIAVIALALVSCSDVAFEGECREGATTACHEKVGEDEHGLICRSGVRVCEAGRWSECRDATTYHLEEIMGASAALIESEQACYDCNPACRQVTGEPEGDDGDGTTTSTGGGITLEPPRIPRSCSPDEDGDRVPDLGDECIDEVGRPQYLGCPTGATAVLAILPNRPREYTVAADLVTGGSVSNAALRLQGAYPDLLVRVRTFAVMSGSCDVQTANDFRRCDPGSRVRFVITLRNDGVIAQADDAQIFDHQVALDDGRTTNAQGTVRVIVPAEGCETAGAIGMDGRGVIFPPGSEGPCSSLVDGDGDSMPDVIDECPLEVGSPGAGGCPVGPARVSAILPEGASETALVALELPEASESVVLEVSDDPGFVSGWTTEGPTSGFCTSTADDSFAGCDAGSRVGFRLHLDGALPASPTARTYELSVDVVRTFTTSRPRRTRVERESFDVVVVVPPTGCDASGAYGVDGMGGFKGTPNGPPPTSDACETMSDRDADRIVDVADDCPDVAGATELVGCDAGTESITAYAPPALPVTTQLRYTFPSGRSTYRELSFELVGEGLPFAPSEVVDLEIVGVDGHCATRDATEVRNCARGTEVTFEVRFSNSSIPTVDVPRVFDFAIDLHRRDTSRSSPVTARVPVRLVIPPSGCTLTGAFSTDGSGDSGDGLSGVVPAHCPADGCACSNGRDDDGDGLVDGADPECTGPRDDDEGTFGTGIPGDNRDPFWQDCFFDGNSGAGDDGCRYHTECLTGERPASHASCQVSDQCRAFCAPMAPNGCDCFGCCGVALDDGSVAHVLIEDTCSMDVIDDERWCTPCTPSSECVNECGRCELCMGKTIDDLPPDCGAPECASGTSCASDGECGDAEICVLGCCSTTGSTCASLDFEAEPIPPNFLIIMDQSGSMAWGWSGGGSRWQGMKDALFDPSEGVITNLQDQVRFAMRTYRGSSRCDDVLEGTSALELNARDDLATFIDSQSPNGGTPTADAIEQATEWLIDQRMSGVLPAGPTALILATDGEPNGCSRSDNYGRDAVVDRVGEAFDAGFPTFVVSIDEDIAPAHLQAVANAGAGVDSGAPYFTVTSTEELRTELTELITSRLGCALDLSGLIDLSRGACGGGSLSLNDEEVPCSADDGWVAIGERQVELRGSWCDRFRDDGAAMVRGNFPCPAPTDPCAGISCEAGAVCELGACVCPPHTYFDDGECLEPEPPMGTFTAVYDADELCMIPPERPTWTWFMWEASIPEGSSLIVEARTAETLAALDAADFESVTVDTQTTHGAIVCPPRDGVAPSFCGVDVGELLGISSALHGLFVEIRVTMVAASADPATYPIIRTIRQEALCAPVE